MANPGQLAEGPGLLKRGVNEWRAQNVEIWLQVRGFEGYEVSDHGRIRNWKTGHIMAQNANKNGVIFVGMYLGKRQYWRSVPRLVALHFVPRDPFAKISAKIFDGESAFDTPINLNGDRTDNRAVNLAWRPRWFAVRFNQQFKQPSPLHIPTPIMDVVTKEIYENSLEVCKVFGLLEHDLVYAIANQLEIWPTKQLFAALD